MLAQLAAAPLDRASRALLRPDGGPRLDFARPLVLGAALGEVPASAAKVAAADAAYLASRTGLQVHGAIGYTAEFDLSLWLTRIRALVTAWGTPAHHRGRVLDLLTRGA